METVNATAVEEELQELLVATTVENPESPSLFPQDLSTTTSILNAAVEALMEDLSSENPSPLSIVSLKFVSLSQHHSCLDVVVLRDPKMAKGFFNCPKTP